MAPPVGNCVEILARVDALPSAMSDETALKKICVALDQVTAEADRNTGTRAPSC